MLFDPGVYLSKVCLSFQTEQMFKNTYFVEHLRMASSVSLLSRYLRGFDLLSFDLLFLLNYTYLATSSTHLSIRRSCFCSCFVIIFNIINIFKRAVFLTQINSVYVKTD